LEGLEERRVLIVLALIEAFCALPVRPVCNILQTLVDPTVFHILRREETVASTRVNEIFELDSARAAVLTRPIRRDGTSRISQPYLIHKAVLGIWLKGQRINLGPVESLGPAASSMAEHQLVRLGANDIP